MGGVGGGSAFWEKFPNNPMIFFEGGYVSLTAICMYDMINVNLSKPS